MRICNYSMFCCTLLYVHSSIAIILMGKRELVALLKETRSVTMSIFRKKYFLFKSFGKNELSYVFTINMYSTAENCMEK